MTVNPIIGSTPPGELFNPAYDCSEILDKDAKAKDGFYWIRLNGSEPIKVFKCPSSRDVLFKRSF